MCKISSGSPKIEGSRCGTRSLYTFWIVLWRRIVLCTLQPNKKHIGPTLHVGRNNPQLGKNRNNPQLGKISTISYQLNFRSFNLSVSVKIFAKSVKFSDYIIKIWALDGVP